MQARFITAQQLRVAADYVSVRVEIKTLSAKGDRHSVKVNPFVASECFTKSGARKRGDAGNAPYQRIAGSTGYRVNAVCWHGFRDFFRACFDFAPDAVFRTAADTWRGSEDFEARYRESGLQNIGTQAIPVAHCEACVCPDRGQPY